MQPGEELPLPEFFRTSDGVRLAFTVDDFTDPWRRSRPLLLLHAAMGSSRRWYAMVPPLARRYRVIRMDLRGHGASEVPEAELPLTMSRLVQDVRELLQHLYIANVDIVGNSAGGYIAQNLAIEWPELVRSLVLFGSTPGLRESQAGTWIPRIAKEGLREFLAATISDRFPSSHDPRHVAWFLDEAAKNDTTWIGRFVGLMASLWWMDELRRIRCPTLLVVPGAETVGHAETYEKMHTRIPDADLITYPGLPHNICDIAPERCAVDILAFLHRRFPED